MKMTSQVHTHGQPITQLNQRVNVNVNVELVLNMLITIKPIIKQSIIRVFRTRSTCAGHL